MIDAEMIDPEQAQVEAPQEIVLDRGAMLNELLEWCNNFVARSAEWRRTNYETNWARWQRASDAIYDPEIARKKESWQSKAVWPVTAAHRENALAQLFRTEVGHGQQLEVKAREGVFPAEMPDLDQSANIRDMIKREREKSKYALGRNAVIDDKTTYGSGFARVRFETVYEDREVRVPDFEPINLLDPGSIMRHMAGKPQQIGEHKEIKEVVIYRGIRFEPLSIWDVFPDPKAIRVRGNAIAYRYQITYGEIVAGVQAGYYIDDAAEKLRGVTSDETTPIDKREVQSDRNLSDVPVARTEYGRNLTCYEVQARLPKKWVLIDGQEIDDPEKLIPAVVRFHPQAVVSVALNESYDGEPNIYKDDYLSVANQFYGRGVPEMLKDVQLVSSETINQRLDSGSISLSQRFAVIEKSIVDPKDIEENRNVVRLKAPGGVALTDVKQVFGRLDMGSVDRTAFIEPQEWERIGQQRTSITPTTLGTEANQDTTLGAQQIQRGVTGEKFAYLGIVSELGFQEDVADAYWKLIYSNYAPEDVALAIGMERAAQFQFMTPEQMNNSYQYIINGIFTMENKPQRQARIQAITAQFAGMPYFNLIQSLRSQLESVDEDPKKFILPEADAMQIMAKAQEIGAGMARQEQGAAGGAKEQSPRGPA